MIGIIGAMEQEVQALLELMNVKEINEKLTYKYYIGTIANKDCVVVQGGIGKVNAAISTTLLLEGYPIDYLINIGSAGGLNLNQDVGDVVISSQVGYHDVDVTAFDYEIGQMAGMPKWFEVNEVLLEKTKNILEKSDVRFHVGKIVSGDSFICRDEQVKEIKEKYSEAMCAEMEAAAVAHVCFVYQIPFIITRSLSDIFGKGNNAIQFDEYLRQASLSSAKMCHALIESL